MQRRTFLVSTTAACLAGCAGGPVTLDGVHERWPPQGRFVDVDGLRIHAWDHGQGAPVVMLHGASGNLRDWTFDLAPRLARTNRAVAFDRPGFGYSDRPKGQAGDPALQARILRTAALKLGIERPILVGHSWGAALAMAWALADPDGIRGVVTVSGAVMPWSERPMLAETIGLDQLVIGWYWNYVAGSAARGGIDRFVSRIFRPQNPPEGYLDHIGAPLSLNPASVTANKQDIATLNRALRRQAPDYGRIEAPVEVISGTADFIIEPERQPIPFVQRLRRAKLTLLEGVGHMAHHVAPDQVLAAIARIEGDTA